MRTKFKLAIVSISIIFTVNAHGQSPSKFFNIESPNVSSLKGSIETSVSLSTGKVDLSIPIYIVKEGDIEVPIVLSYNSGGVKLDLHPGWVGSNWHLQSGGVITRNVKGVPDELYWKNDFYLTPGNEGTDLRPYGYGFSVC